MRPISSKATFFYKRIFPVIWFGFLLVFVVVGLTGGSRSGGMFSVAVPVLMMIFGYFLMKKFAFNLVDEVFDEGDSLVIRNGGQSEQVPLAEIINVSYSPYVNPSQVTLTLRRPGVFGNKVTFCAPLSLMGLSSNPAIDRLIERIDAARRQ